jgi:multiple sugar transport system ATP-binding protein
MTLRGIITAVRGVDLSIDDREFFVLLGPSGCGKSTLLNLIAGLERPSRGEIWFDDRLVTSAEQKIFVSPRERNVAMVFQSYALYPHLSVYENIAFPLRVMGGRGATIEDAVGKAASILEITDLLSAKPRELSGGQRQRVAIARAIVRQPDIFLLDEPLSNLDAQLRVSTRAELKRLQRDLGITAVYVTHDQVEAMTLGDRIAVLRNGTVEQIGTPKDLYETPANTFVATFIGTPPMNLLKASYIQEGGILYLVVAGKRFEVPRERGEDLQGMRMDSFIFGIRPEHIEVAPHPSNLPFVGTVGSVELLGREILLHVSMEGNKVMVITDRLYREGDKVSLAFDLNRARFFEG